MTNMPINHIDERCVAPRLNVKAVGLVLGDLDNPSHPPEMSLILELAPISTGHLGLTERA